jgi:outer membrane protein
LKFLLLFFLLYNTLLAQDNYSFRLATGKASQNDLGQIVFGDFGSHPNDLRVYAFDGGYLLHKNEDLSLYVKSGFSYFDEDIVNDAYEVTLYLKLYYNIPYLKKRVRFGFGEGSSYTSKYLLCEYLEAEENEDKNSKILNYLDISLDIDLGRVFNSKALYGTYLGYALKHRSGIFGLINNVKKGGSNYNTFYIEKNF